MRFRKTLAIACMLNLMGSYVFPAAPPAVINQMVSELTADSNLLSGWLVDQMKWAIPFNSTSGNVVPGQLKLFGFELGAEIVTSGTQVDVDALHQLPTTLVNTQSIDTFSRFPLPTVLGQAKVGLPWGFDAGIRFGGIPKTTYNNNKNSGEIKNKIFGLDLRNKLIEEGAAKFGLTLGLNYTHADGEFNVTAPFNSLQSIIQGHTVTMNDGISANNANWNTNSYGVQAIVDKKLAIFIPYVGASTNYNTGHVNNSITTTGTPVVDGIPDAAISAVGGSTANVNKWDNRLLLGFEIIPLPFFRIGLGGEYAGNKNVAGSFSLRFQFH